jgi:hypothetical protein
MPFKLFPQSDVRIFEWMARFRPLRYEVKVGYRITSTERPETHLLIAARTLAVLPTQSCRKTRHRCDERWRAAGELNRTKNEEVETTLAL